ncbi:MAG: flippase-like domain-containing protein [Synechococcales cyanobacterium RM1_1_8]|nr:flippase-like domain-containing protein [Synechococcales cyanobacterium RM1_1_8]
MKRLLSLAVSLVILVLIYWKVDFAELIAVLRNCDRRWLPTSLAMVIPITLITAWRLQQLMPRSKRGDRNLGGAEISPLPFGEANRLILAASALNMVLPSKMGDIAKAYFMGDRGHLDRSLSLSLVVFEKACDMLSLLLWCAFGLLLYPQKDGLFWFFTVSILGGLALGLLLLGSAQFAQAFFNLGRNIAPKKMKPKFEKLHKAWGEMHRYFWSDKTQLAKITLTSVFLWFLHLLQIWFFILALRETVPALANFALSPLAILAGLLPLTFAGVGTRDAALVLFYQPYMPEAAAAALGVLCTSRYFLPAIGGLPFLNQYLSAVKTMKAR